MNVADPIRDAATRIAMAASPPSPDLARRLAAVLKAEQARGGVPAEYLHCRLEERLAEDGTRGGES